MLIQIEVTGFALACITYLYKQPCTRYRSIGRVLPGREPTRVSHFARLYHMEIVAKRQQGSRGSVKWGKSVPVRVRGIPPSLSPLGNYSSLVGDT